METHRNGFVPFINQPQYSQQYARIPISQPSQIPLNGSPIQHMMSDVNQPCSNNNVNLVLQPIVENMVPSMYNTAPRIAARTPHVHPQAYYTNPTEHWHFNYHRYEAQQGNNFNQSLKNCNNQPRHETPAPVQSRWIKPTIFYDGFWTEQKVKKWISEQFIEESPMAATPVKNKACHSNRAH